MVPSNSISQTARQIGRVNRIFLTAFERQVGIPAVHSEILTALGGASTALAQKDLVSSIGVDAGYLTRQIQALEAQGLISRTTDGNDQRIRNVVLTVSGREKLAALQEKQTAFLAKAGSSLSAAQATALIDGLSLLEIGIAAPAAVAPATTSA